MVQTVHKRTINLRQWTVRLTYASRDTESHYVNYRQNTYVLGRLNKYCLYRCVQLSMYMYDDLLYYNHNYNYSLLPMHKPINEHVEHVASMTIIIIQCDEYTNKPRLVQFHLVVFQSWQIPQVVQYQMIVCCDQGKAKGGGQNIEISSINNRYMYRICLIRSRGY